MLHTVGKLLSSGCIKCLDINSAIVGHPPDLVIKCRKTVVCNILQPMLTLLWLPRMSVKHCEDKTRVNLAAGVLLFSKTTHGLQIPL